MEMPLVSVIVPMYNTELYVDELIDSVLAQTLENFELIIVDDCSTDNSCAVVESYMPKSGGRLKLVKSFKNEGQQGLGTFARQIYFFRGQRRYAHFQRAGKFLQNR